MNLEGGQLVCMTKGKCNHECPGYCHQNLFYLEVVAVLVLIHPYLALSGVIVGINQDDDKSNFIFLIGAGMSG